MNLKGKQTKRGFTLIELLAVIVILAIIALIATPIVLNMINKAKKNAARSSALGYVDAIEYNNGFADVEQEGYTKVTGTKQVSELSEIKLKGKRPTSGTVTINEKGTVTRAELCINGYNVTYENNDAIVGSKCSDGESSTSQSTFRGTVVAATSSDTHKGVVYMNPTDLTKECTSSNSTSTTGTKTGCMKFYIYDDSGDTYKMILDHNTTATVAWVTKDDYLSAGGTEEDWNNYIRNSKGPLTVNAQLATDTAGWKGDIELITAQEIATITNTTTYDGSSSKWFYFNGTGDNKQTKASSSRGDNEYAWLFDYTNGCESYGCNTADSSIKGYWTSSPVSDSSNFAWYVFRDGTLDRRYVDDDDRCGVRPVITLSKSEFSS